MMQQRDGTHTFLVSLLAGLLALCLAVPALAGVSARLDRNKIYEGDQVTLIIESDGRKSGEPDLSALGKDFKVLGNSTSTQVNIINGRRSDKTSWTVQLQPLQSGKLRIPPLKVGAEQTQAIELTVSDVPEEVSAQQAEHLFIEVETDRNGPVYVQQQIPYTVRLYYDEHVLSGDLQAPQPEDAVVEQLGGDKNYSVKRNGRNYQVVERHYAISPEKSGKLQIPAVKFGGRMASAQNTSAKRSRNDRLVDRFFRGSPFANDPFFGKTPFSDPGEPVRIHSKAITVEVQARPASAGKNWLPAEQVILEDSWVSDPPQWRAGEPVTRTITLQATGLTGVQIPALQLEQPDQTRLYPESPVNESRTDGDKVYGISRQTFTYIPGKAGKLAIPSVELNWWNTRTDQQETARLTRWEIEVEAGLNESQTPVQAPVTATSEHNIEAINTDGPRPDKQQPEDRSDQINAVRPWLIAGGLLALLGITGAVLKRLRQKSTGVTAVKHNTRTNQDVRTLTKKHMQQLARACDANDAQAAAHALLELGSVRWPDTPPRNLGAFATRLGQGQIQIMALDRALYAADGRTWNAADLYRTVNTAWEQKPSGEKPATDGLEPLYPQSV